MRITFAIVVSLAKSKGIIVERGAGKKIFWWHKNHCAVVGECQSIAETYNEIYWEQPRA